MPIWTGDGKHKVLHSLDCSRRGGRCNGRWKDTAGNSQYGSSLGQCTEEEAVWPQLREEAERLQVLMPGEPQYSTTPICFLLLHAAISETHFVALNLDLQTWLQLRFREGNADHLGLLSFLPYFFSLLVDTFPPSNQFVFLICLLPTHLYSIPPKFL